MNPKIGEIVAEVRHLAAACTTHDLIPLNDKLYAIADKLEALGVVPECDMGKLCLGCEPRRADGSCPCHQPKQGESNE